MQLLLFICLWHHAHVIGLILCSSLGTYGLLESCSVKEPGDLLFNTSARSARSVYTTFVFHS